MGICYKICAKERKMVLVEKSEYPRSFQTITNICNKCHVNSSNTYRHKDKLFYNPINILILCVIATLIWLMMTNLSREAA